MNYVPFTKQTREKKPASTRMEDFTEGYSLSGRVFISLAIGWDMAKAAVNQKRHIRGKVVSNFT